MMLLIFAIKKFNMAIHGSEMVIKVAPYVQGLILAKFYFFKPNKSYGTDLCVYLHSRTSTNGHHSTTATSPGHFFCVPDSLYIHSFSPLHNGHFFVSQRTVHTFIRFHLSTTATSP